MRRAWEVTGTDATAEGKFFPVLHLPTQQFKERGQEFEVGAAHLNPAVPPLQMQAAELRPWGSTSRHIYQNWVGGGPHHPQLQEFMV